MIGTTYSQAHGLGAYPSDVAVWLENTSTEHGWAVGSRILFASASGNGSSAAAAITVGCDTTNAYAVTSSTPVPAIANFTTQVSAVMTPNKWKVIIGVRK